MCKEYKNKVYIRPRRTGKTTWLIDKFIREYAINSDCYFIVLNENMKDMVRNVLYNAYRFESKHPIFDHIITQSQYIFNTRYIGISFRKIKLFIDEIDLMSKEFKRELYGSYQYIAVTTPARLYNKEQIDKIRFWLKARRDGFGNVLCSMDELTDRYGDDSLIYSHMIDINTEIIEWKEDYRKMLSPDQFKIEILGELWSE